MMKKMLLLLIPVFLVFACQSGDDSTETDNSEMSQYPKEVSELIMPDGWNDEVLDIIASGEVVQKPVVAIVDFDSNIDLALNVNDLGLTDLLTNAMFETNKFEMVERDKLESVFAEQNLANSDDFAETDVAMLGELLGAGYILTGKISAAYRNIEDKFSHYELTASLTLNLRAIDTTTGKIFKSAEAVGEDTTILVVDDRGNVIKGPAEYREAYISSEGSEYSISGINMAKQFVGAAQKAIRGVANQIEGSFPLIGYVLTADSTKIMTDVGSQIGAKNGDYLIIVRLGEEIIHPATKKVIGREKEVIGSAVIETVGKSETYAKLIKMKEEGMTPASGDLVISIAAY